MTVVIFYIVLVLLSLLAAALFSGTETGLISLNGLRIKELAEKGDLSARYLDSILESPDIFLSVTLSGTNLSLVLSTALATKVFTILFPSQGSFLVSLVMVPSIVIFGEVIPKAVFRRRSEEILLTIVPLLKLAMIVLYWPSVIIGICSRKALQFFGVKEVKAPCVTREELLAYVKSGVSEGTLDTGQQRMLRGAFSFSATFLREVMIPLTSVEAISIDDSVLTVYEKSRETGFYRFPVYSDRIDNVVGIINSSNLIYGEYDKFASVSSVMRQPLYLPNTVSIDRALLRMQHLHEQMAIVVDEYGGCDGIVTIDDIFEQVVGDLDSPQDLSDEIVVLSPKNYQIDGDIDIDLLNIKLGVDFPKRGYETLGGFIMTRLQRIPVAGDSFEFGELYIEVLAMDGQAIDKVNLRPKR